MATELTAAVVVVEVVPSTIEFSPSAIVLAPTTKAFLANAMAL